MKRSPLKRRAADCQPCARRGRTICGCGSTLERGGRLERRTRLKPVNKKRQAKLDARNFHSDERRAWVRNKCCAYCGRDDDTIRNDHVEKRGMGGCGGDYTRILPACLDCDTIHEGKGIDALLEARGLTWDDVEWKLAAINREWREYEEASR